MNKITEDKKPHPKEVEVVENSKNTSLDNTGKLHDLAKVIKKNITYHVQNFQVLL